MHTVKLVLFASAFNTLLLVLANYGASFVSRRIKEGRLKRFLFWRL